MRKWLTLVLLCSCVLLTVSFIDSTASLRTIYSRHPSKWPTPLTDAGVTWQELGALPAGPFHQVPDSARPLIELGKILFFDPRLSSSGKISCASCHQPELHWTDGKERSLGHEETVNKRNSPTIQNTWFYKRLFWDGRARDLEDQAFAPINSESEMHSDMATLPAALRKIDGYPMLFEAAFGDRGIYPNRIATAIAAFERTVQSGETRFDRFLKGERQALSNAELRGLHLFRRKARCMNCHNGALFTDDQFHRNGLPTEDKGRYMVTHLDEDTGKFKTPSLRDVMLTGPWMHDGRLKDIRDIIMHYNKLSPSPTTSATVPLRLTKAEAEDLVAFLQSLSSGPVVFKKPVLPGL